MDIDTHNELETKAGIPLDAVVTHADMMRAFEAFKDAIDQRLSKRDNDVVLEEKLARESKSGATLIRLLQPSLSRGTVNPRAATGWIYAVMLSNADVICMSVLSTAKLAA